MGTVKTITRRSFLVASTGIAGGVAFGTYQYRKPMPNPLLADGEAATDEVSLNPYLKIDQSGVTVITPKAEMGQGVHSMFAMLVAEELDLDWNTVKTEHGPASNAYYNTALLRVMAGFHDYNQSQTANRVRDFTGVAAKFLGIQLTGGSTSAQDGFIKLRSAGASARLALTLAAARQWNVPATGLKTENGYVINPATGDKLSYTELAVAAADIEAPKKPPLRDPQQWRYLGKSMPRVDIPAKCTGRAIFASDIQLPDMLYATVKMSPRFGAGIKRADTGKAEAMPGVEKIIQLENSGFAVIANNTWHALRAAEAIEVEWEDVTYPQDNAGIMEQYVASFNAEPNGTFTEEGNVELAFADAGDALEVEYRVPHLAHATMEPMSIVGQVKDGRIDLWAGTQSPTRYRDVVADMAGIEKHHVHIHTTLLGGGFGRRGEIDCPTQAYRIASETNGRPVKICWSREEDMRHDFYRPAAIARMKGVMADNKPLAMDAQIASPSIMDYRAKHNGDPALPEDMLIVEGTSGQPDQIDNIRIRGYAPELDIPIGFWRSVGASFNGFVHECFMDEMAASKDLDPIEMKLATIGNLSPTATIVVERVKDMAGWTGRKGEAGIGRGFAYTLSFGAHTAQIVDVRMTDSGVKIDKVYCAVDVGTALDPRNVEAQIESGIIYGLSAAISGELTFKDGEVVQS
ncbi:MAG: molybdopterin cofactor-binding domain-containing protein, partial [Pseudomonadota bacterium]